MEMEGATKANTHILLIPSPTNGIGEIMSCQNFRSLSRHFRVTVHVIKFARALIKATSKVPSTEALPEHVEAERLWVIEAQIAVIQDKKFHTRKKQFNLFFYQHGVWRSGGQLDKVNLSYLAGNII